MDIFWGETHENVFQMPQWPVSLEDNVGFAREHLDFYAPALYTAAHTEVETLDGKGRVLIERWKDPGTLTAQWEAVQEATATANEPGRFVTFPGYEWQGDGQWGDHNVVHRHEGHDLARVDTLPELYATLQGQDAIAIPHHTAYLAGCRGRDWAVVDESISPFTEVCSVHGSSETDEECCCLRANPRMGPGVAGGTYQDALDQGRHLGAIASTDGTGLFPGHYNWGLMACLAPELTRAALWDAFRERRVYGVTGDRVALDFRIGEALMGGRITARGPRRVTAAVTGCAALDRIELLRNGQVIHTHCHQGTWQQPAGRSHYKLRIEAGWGPFASDSGAFTREWPIRVELGGEGRFAGWSPCWTSPGQECPELAGGVATFVLRSPPVEPAELRISPTQNANVLEFAADPSTPITVTAGDLRFAGIVADLCAGSRILWDKVGSRRFLRDRSGIDVTTEERPTINYCFAHKVKLHRTIPATGYTAAIDIVDDDPLATEANYRIRVSQRNGQQAWSSPIWVQPAP